jgi:putative aldouronate transport system permease protein
MLGLNGIVNYALSQVGIAPIQFLGSGPWFRFIIIITDVWKGFGFGTIVYLAAILAISPNLYEAAIIDGANRLQRILHVTIPSMMPTIVLMATLSLGGVLNAGFDQVFNMYNSLVYSHADIIDTFVYRIGLISMQYGLSTAVGLLKSIISSVLIVTSYGLAYKFAGYRIF